MTVSVTDAKNRFTELLIQVENGERIIIERYGRPIAEIQQPQARRPPRFGTLKDRIKILDANWATPQSEEDWIAGK